MEEKTKLLGAGPENTVARLFIVLFYISLIDSYRLLVATAILTLIYGSMTCGRRLLVSAIRPILPFIVLMIIPAIVRYLLPQSLGDLNFVVMIVGKVVISSALLASSLGKNSPLYLIEGILEMGLPKIFNRILTLTLRYFYMVNQDIQMGSKALKSRGMAERRGLSYISILGEWIGGFFLKSSYHSEVVFNAMKSRGFEGESNSEKSNKLSLILESAVISLFFMFILMVDGVL